MPRLQVPARGFISRSMPRVQQAFQSKRSQHLWPASSEVDLANRQKCTANVADHARFGNRSIRIAIRECADCDKGCCRGCPSLCVVARISVQSIVGMVFGDVDLTAKIGDDRRAETVVEQTMAWRRSCCTALSCDPALRCDFLDSLVAGETCFRTPARFKLFTIPAVGRNISCSISHARLRKAQDSVL